MAFLFWVSQLLAAVFTEVLRKEVRYNSVPPEVYRAFGFPGADDLGNMFQFKRDFEDYYCGVRNPDFARSLNPSLRDFQRGAQLPSRQLTKERLGQR
jgi:hypothetical protein